MKKQNKVISNHYNDAHHITNALVLIAGASEYKGGTINKNQANFPWNLSGVLKDIERCYDLFSNFYHYDVMCTYDKNDPSTTWLTDDGLDRFIRRGYRELDNNDEDDKNQYDALIFLWAGHGGDGTLITPVITKLHRWLIYKIGLTAKMHASL